MESTSTSNATPQLPPPPSPSADAAIAPTTTDLIETDGSLPDDIELDIFSLNPLAALKILCDLLEALARLTGDVPPTPPVSRPATAQAVQATTNDENKDSETAEPDLQKRRSRQWIGDDSDVPHTARTPIGSPEARPTEPVHIEIVDAGFESSVPQQLAVARKFYSKKPPSIPLKDYLLRLHQFCPMSTAVFLATSLYIHRLAMIEKSIPITPRNTHRLVLAGLRVAMKALEDLSYPHSRFAKVGGVTEAELGRLEISFCFITDFELRVTSENLQSHAEFARTAATIGTLPEMFHPKLPLLTKRPAQVIQSL